MALLDGGGYCEQVPYSIIILVEELVSMHPLIKT